MADRIEDLQKRLAKDPNSKIFAQLAEELRRAGMLREAIATCRDGLAKHPTYFSARVALGRALLEAGNFEEARVELEKVLAQVPDNILAHKFLGETYHHLGRLEEALGKYEMAQSLAPGDTEVADRILKLNEEIRSAKQPPPTFRPVQDDLAMEFSDATVVAPPTPSATVRDAEFAVEGEMIFDANNPSPVEAEIVLEPEEKPGTSVFERQAREMRDSEPLSDDARMLQEHFESGPLTSTFKRQVREIRDAGVKGSPQPERSGRPGARPAGPTGEDSEARSDRGTPPPPGRRPPTPVPPPQMQDRYIEPEPMEETIVPPQSAPAAHDRHVDAGAISPAQEQVFDFGDQPAELPREDFEVGELTSYFLGRTAAPADDAATYAPPPIPKTPSLSGPPEVKTPAPAGFDVDRVPGTQSFAFLGESATAIPVDPSESEGESLTSRALADLYYSQGHYEQALSLYQNLEMTRPGDVEVRRRVADIQERLKPKEEPVAVAAQPRSAPARAMTNREDAARAALRELELWLGVVRKR